MTIPKLVTKLTEYTDFNKARAFEDVIGGLQLLLEDYSKIDGDVAEIVQTISARLLDLAWRSLQEPGSIISQQKKDPQ
jgi:hypothetical protein